MSKEVNGTANGTVSQGGYNCAKFKDLSHHIRSRPILDLEIVEVEFEFTSDFFLQQTIFDIKVIAVTGSLAITPW